MNKITIDELVSLEICDAIIDDISVGDGVNIVFSGTGFREVVFKRGHIHELRIRGYEVFDEDEEPLFDMPDVEVLGDKIPEALESLLACEPYAVEFKNKDGRAVLVCADSTDTYELEIEYEEIGARC